MDDCYAQNLGKLKGSFLGTNEQPELLDVVRGHFDVGVLKVLDVGTGGGQSIGKLAEAARTYGLDMEVTGIDVLLPPTDELVQNPQVALVQCPLHDFRPGQVYDLVNASQSVYYLGDPRASLRQMLSLVRPGGLLTVTVWQESCVLNRIHRHVFGETMAASLTANFVAAELQAIAPASDTRIRAIEGRVDLASWSSSEDLLQAAVRVISRSPSPTMLTSEQVVDLRSHLSTLPAIEKRHNGLVHTAAG